MRWKEISPPIDQCCSALHPEFYSYAACAEGRFAYHDGKIQWLCTWYSVQVVGDVDYMLQVIPLKEIVTKMFE